MHFLIVTAIIMTEVLHFVDWLSGSVITWHYFFIFHWQYRVIIAMSTRWPCELNVSFWSILLKLLMLLFFFGGSFVFILPRKQTSVYVTNTETRTPIHTHIDKYIHLRLSLLPCIYTFNLVIFNSSWVLNRSLLAHLQSGHMLPVTC